MLVLSILPIHMYWSCVYVCVCVLHTYRRVKQLTVKIKSNNRAPLTLALTHRPSHSRTHERTLQLTASHAAHLLFSLSRTPAQWRQLSWIIAAGSFLQFALWWWWWGAGTSTGDDVGVDTTSCSAALRTAEHSAAQRCSCLLLLWLRCPFAFRIPHPDAAKGSEALSTASCGVRSWLSVRDEISWLMDVCSFPRFHSSTTVHQHQQPPVKQRLNRHLWHFEEDVRRYLRAENVV